MLSPEICTNTTTTATATASATATAIASATTAASTTTTKASSPTPPVVKTKKRRRQKRRKRARHATACTGTSDNSNNSSNQNNNNGTGTQLDQPLLGCVSATATSVSGGRKCKAQYFQHDNRKYIAKYESFHFTAEATTAAALNYAAVAKKFKPLRPPMLASGAKKNRRTALIRKSHGECACVCQNLHVPQCPQEAVAHGGAQKTADHHCRERKEERGRPQNEAPMKININGQALPALLELLKQTPSTWLKTLLLGAAGSAVVGR